MKRVIGIQYCRDCKHMKETIDELKTNGGIGCKSHWYCSIADMGEIPYMRTLKCPYYKRKWWKFWVK